MAKTGRRSGSITVSGRLRPEALLPGPEAEPRRLLPVRRFKCDKGVSGPMNPTAPHTAKLPSWYRALALVVGLISIALAFVLLAYPGLALLTVVFLLAFFFLVIGIDRLVAGVTGHPYGFSLMPMMGAPKGPAPGTGDAPAGSTPPK
jgi:hypothetical protein